MLLPACPARAADELHLPGERERTGVARMRALDQVGQRHHLAAALVMSVIGTSASRYTP